MLKVTRSLKPPYYVFMMYNWDGEVSNRHLKPPIMEVAKYGISQLGFTLSCRVILAGNISSRSMVNGLEGYSPVASRQKWSPCLVNSAVYI